MKITLIIDKKNPLYCDDEMMFITIAHHINWLNDLLKNQGYVYTNYIYEIFNVVWNPKCDNNVFLYENFEKFSYICEKDIDNGSFIIKIKGESR